MKSLKNLIFLSTLSLISSQIYSMRAPIEQLENQVWGGHVATLPHWENDLWGSPVVATEPIHNNEVIPSPPPQKISHISGSTYQPIDKGTPTAITGLKGERGIYYPKAGLASIVPTGSYDHVVEYLGGGRPAPSINNKEMVPFAKMPNPNFTGRVMPGAPAKDIILYGMQTAVNIPSSVLNPLEQSAPSQTNNTAIRISDAQGRSGLYLPHNKIAYLKDKHGKTIYFDNVTTFVLRPGLAPEYNKTPHDTNPKLINFAFYTTDQKQHQLGSPSAKTQLYGEKVKKKPLISVISIDGQTYGVYDPIHNTIKFKSIVYTNITEYLGGGRTPPSVSNPALKPVATMQNPHYNPNSHLPGAQATSIVLFGQLASPIKTTVSHKQTTRNSQASPYDQVSDLEPLSFEPGIALSK